MAHLIGLMNRIGLPATWLRSCFSDPLHINYGEKRCGVVTKNSQELSPLTYWQSILNVAWSWSTTTNSEHEPLPASCETWRSARRADMCHVRREHGTRTTIALQAASLVLHQCLCGEYQCCAYRFTLAGLLESHFTICPSSFWNFNRFWWDYSKILRINGSPLSD